MEHHRTADPRTDDRAQRRRRPGVDDAGEPAPRPHAPARSIYDQPRLPLNRILTVFGPYISLVSGALAAWLSQHFPGLVSHGPATAKEITQGATFVVGALVTWALQHRYLIGWQSWEQGLIDLEKARRGNIAADRRARFAPGYGNGGYDDDPTGDDGEPSFDAELIFDPASDQPA